MQPNALPLAVASLLSIGVALSSLCGSLSMADEPQKWLTLEGHSGEVMCVSFHPDSKVLATGSADKTIKLWDASTGKALVTIEGHNDRVDQVVMVRNPLAYTLVASAFGERQVSVWLWNEKDAPVRHQLDRSTVVESLAAHSRANTNTITLGSGIRDATVAIQGVVLSQDKKQVALVFRGDKAASSIVRGATIDARRYKGWIPAAAFSADGQFLATGGDDNSIRIWKVANPKAKSLDIRNVHSRNNNNPGIVRSLAFSPDGKWLASGGENGAKLWEVATGKSIDTLEADGRVWCVAFSPDGKILATASDKVRLWDVASRKGVATFGSASRCVAFRPDGMTLAVVERGGKVVQLWAVPQSN